MRGWKDEKINGEKFDGRGESVERDKKFVVVLLDVHFIDKYFESFDSRKGRNPTTLFCIRSFEGLRIFNR